MPGRSHFYALRMGLALLSITGLTPAADIGKTPCFVHYMPWYANKKISGNWGWHWTMNHFHPDTLRADGHPHAAAADPPLLGLYDSSDPDLLECHVLQMKFAGIDGVIIDWYGREDFYDYATLHRNTERLIPFLIKAGLKFAICYEDQSVIHMIKENRLRNEDAATHGEAVFRWLDSHWFTDPAYLKIENRPVLLVFGPQFFPAAQWTAFRDKCLTHPLFFFLPHPHEEKGADGIYGWPPVEGGKSIPPEQWRKHLQDLIALGKSGQRVIPYCLPGFEDLYQQAGIRDSYGRIDPREGATLTESLALAMDAQAPLIQIVTWNDYGEGTMVEPTQKKGYTYLKILQKALTHNNTYHPADLELPLLLYNLRKKTGNTTPDKTIPDAAAALLFSGQCAEAKALLEKDTPTGE